jgi:hypothetical protein
VVTDAVWKATTGRMASDSVEELPIGPSVSLTERGAEAENVS